MGLASAVIKAIFYRQPSKMQILLTVKKIQGSTNITISADLHFSKTLFRDTGRPCNLLISVNISKLYKGKAKTTSISNQNTTVPITVKPLFSGHPLLSGH